MGSETGIECAAQYRIEAAEPTIFELCMLGLGVGLGVGVIARFIAEVLPW